jgi:hypothetical protein
MGRHFRAAGFALAALALSGCVSGAATPVGHFVGKYELVQLTELCKDAGGKPLVPHRQCATMRNGHQYKAFVRDFSFVRPNGEVVTIKAGSRTDQASIPQALWSMGLPPDGDYAPASAPHDACYRSHGTFLYFGFVGRTRPEPYTRAECDQILLEGMEALNVSAWKRTVIYQAVRLGGAEGWGR